MRCILRKKGSGIKPGTVHTPLRPSDRMITPRETTGEPQIGSVRGPTPTIVRLMNAPAVGAVTSRRVRTLAARVSSSGSAAVIAGLLLYALWAVNVTWPLVTLLDDGVLGGIGDQTGGVAALREWMQVGAVPFLPGRIPDFGAPEGIPVEWGVNLVSWSSTLPIWIFALAFGPFAGFSLTNLLAFILGGVFAQLLVTRLTASRAAGIIGGFAFAFTPYAVTKVATHPQLGHGWPLALLAWRMVAVAQAPTWRNVAAASGAAVVVLSYTPYFLLIGGVLLATCMALTLAYGARIGAFRVHLFTQTVIAMIAALYVAVLAIFTLGRGGGSLRHHAPEEFTTYAARPAEYVVPYARGGIFGDTFLPYLAANQHGSNFSETTLYLGVVVLALAAAALIAAVGGWLPNDLKRPALAGLVVAVVAFVWSLPPQLRVGIVELPAPIAILGEITSTWRVMSRFVVLVSLGMTVLAAVGLVAIMRSRGRILGTGIAVLALAGVMLDFTWRPGVTELGEAPEVYGLLREEPRGVVAQYPLLPAGFGDSSPILWQDAHGHPLLNGYIEGSPNEARAASLYYLNAPATARGLASIGVKHVIVPDSPDAYAGTMHPGQPGDGFRFVAKGRYYNATASIYMVTATPDAGVAYLYSGGSPYSEGPLDDPFRWTTEEQARIVVDTPMCGDPCLGRLQMRLSSPANRRVLTIREPSGNLVWRGVIGNATDVSVPLSVLGGRLSLDMFTAPAPGPTAIDSSEQASDGRQVVLSLSRMRFVR